jgi:NAD(P)-dependent dehydrogenase (short-subunit alcohol dehydrogenase family)
LNPRTTPWDLPKRTLVTGAASGIGKSTVELLRQHDVEVVAVDLSAEGLSALADPGIEIVPADLRRPEDRAAVIAAAGPVQGLVNSAGMIRLTPLAEVSDEDWDEILAINLKAAFFLAREIGQGMERGGSIVNVSSVAARRGDNEEVLCYAASKAAVLSVTRSLAHAFGPRGVRANAILPGLVETRMQAKVLERVSEIRGVPVAELEAGRSTGVPLEGRLGSAAECAGPIAFLLSASASYITGQGLSVDGGIVMP